MDFSSWARHATRYQDWTALDFRDPQTGLFLAARAAVEDPRTQATLTLTAAPARGCEADTVIVVKQPEAAAADSETVVSVRLRSGDGPPERLATRIVASRGDWFVFLELLAPLNLEKLERQTKLVVEAGNLRFTFSLRGFSDAWRQSREICKTFLIR